jgi:hypothetical protein
MSSSCRDVAMAGGYWALRVVLSVVGVGAIVQVVAAAEVWVQPIVTLSAETDSNLDLDTSAPQRIEGYSADAATLIDIATPTSDTTIKPRVRYEDYPEESVLDIVEGTLDFRSRVVFPRGDFSITGRFDHLTEPDAEFQTAEFNDVNPIAPTNPETGVVQLGVTRDNLTASPQYSYHVTPLMSVVASALVETVKFSPSDTADHVDFDYYQGGLSINRALDQKTDLSIGAFGNRYDAGSVGSYATSAGASLNLEHNWTPLVGGTASVSYQHSDITVEQPNEFQAGVNTWGASLGAVAKGLTDQFRLNVARTVTPSGAGGLYASEQAQVQYTRFFSLRLSVTGALLYLQSRALTSNFSGIDRDYGQGDISIKWMAAPTWFVLGGFTYTGQKYLTDPTGAANNRVYLEVGYQGLPRPQ